MKLTFGASKTLGLGALITVGLASLASCARPVAQVPPANSNVPQTAAPTAPNPVPSDSTQVISLDDAAERIDDALDEDATLREFDLDADDEQNSIVLEGQVRDATQRSLAEDIARRIAPTASIVNQITIQ